MDGSKEKSRPVYAKAGLAAAATVVFILALELGLRLAGYPKGLFEYVAVTGHHLYPPNQATLMTWGFAPYLVESNNLGMRGPDVSFEKPAGATRIACIGDSVTDGIFVENQYTYPRLLEALLVSRGHDAEVLNMGKGGIGIVREHVILKSIALPLDPDLVVLTFVTNDVADIIEGSDEALAEAKEAQPTRDKALAWLMSETALGEVWFDFYLGRRAREYGGSEGRPPLSMARYRIEGGADHAKNVAEFKSRWRGADGLVLRDEFPPRVGDAVDEYLRVLGLFAEDCEAAGVELVFVYFPAYSQVYDPGESMRVRDVLAGACEEMGVDFLDLTPRFRAEGKDKVLHLAPKDFHPNPLGNRVMAEAMADFIEPRL